MKKKKILKLKIVWINLLCRRNGKNLGTERALAEDSNNIQLTFIIPVFRDLSFINPRTLFQGIKDCEVYIKIYNEDFSTNPI